MFGISTNFDDQQILHPLLFVLITAIGAYKLVHLLISFISFVCKITYTFILPGNLDLRKLGQWGVVTGCTEGIGKSYAELLAQRGIDLVLIGRNADKLESLSNSLQEAHKIKTKIVVVNFKYSDIYHQIQATLQDLDICVLVNNVGVAYRLPGRFLEVDQNVHSSMININCLSCLMLTSLVLPGMLRKDKGVIVNISSASGNTPIPQLATYSATKALINYFTRALQYEYSRSKLIIQLVCPMSVKTRIDFKTSEKIAPLPDTYVKSALKSIGRLAETNGCLSHELQDLFRILFLPKVFNIDMWFYFRIVDDLKNLPVLREYS